MAELFHAYRGPVGFGEKGYNGPDCMTDYFRVYRLPGEKKGGEKRRPGRPRVYNGIVRRSAAAALRKVGLTPAVEYLRKEKGIKVSVTFLRAVAKEEGITFQLGRPKLAA